MHVALKYIKKSQIEGEMEEYLKKEIANQQSLSHKNLVKLISVEQTERCYVLVLELCQVDLKKYVTDNKNLSEVQIRNLFSDVVQGVLHLHENNLVHRDLKLENCLLDVNGVVKISDFGFSKRIGGNDMCSTRIGTLMYMPPEVSLGKSYDYSADIWSLGIVLFYLLFQKYPYSKTKDDYSLERCVRQEVFEIPMGRCSKEALDLLNNMLIRDPSKRWNIQQVAQSSWFTCNLQVNAQEVQEVVIREEFRPIPVAIVEKNVEIPVTNLERNIDDVPERNDGSKEVLEPEIVREKPNPLADPTLIEFEVITFTDYPESKNGDLGEGSFCIIS